MDHFKALWSKNKANRRSSTASNKSQQNGHHLAPEIVENNVRNPELDPMAKHQFQPVVIRHEQLSAKHPLDDRDVLVEVDSFQNLGKIQPFHVSIASSALLLVDLHAHLSPEPVCGYLAGHWDLNAHNLAITHTFPCLTDTKDPEKAKECETDIYNAIYNQHLSLIGWYKTTPGHKALPTIRDAEAQLDNQIKLLGSSDATYSPCIGMIIAPYTSGSSESEILTYWVAPPPENVYPQEYGKPLKMSHSVVIDPCLSQETLDAIEKSISFYNSQDEKVPFLSKYNSDTLYITKMGRTLLPKFPKDQDEKLWKHIRVLVLGEQVEQQTEDPLVARLLASKKRRRTNDSEEEIDDDEENALKNFTQRNGHAKVTSRKRSSNHRSTEDSVSLVAIPPEVTIAPSVTITPTTTEAPLDFSSTASSKEEQTAPLQLTATNRGEVDDSSDDDRLMIHE